jgi:hypothetical protein
MKEIDLREDVFTIQTDDRMRIGSCAMFDGKKLVYFGQIERSPSPQTGWVVFLHPDDFEEVDKSYRKEMN